MSKSKRESFIFYASFKSGIDQVEDDADKLAIYEMITSYALYRKKPKAISGQRKLVWELVSPQLDANWLRYKKGSRGGAPIGNTNASKKTTSKQLQNNLKQPQNNLM